MSRPRRLTTPSLLACTLALSPLALSGADPAQTSASGAKSAGQPAAAAAQRFSSFENASQTVVDAVGAAQALADSVRRGEPSAAVTPEALSVAVSRAGAAIVQEGRMARSALLAERQAALTRLRLAQTDEERQRIVEELRLQAGRRMDEQREAARLVRDRLRELRASTALTSPGGN